MIRLTSVGLRSLSLVSKFILLFFLARVLPPADVGLYGLVVATVGYAVMGIGLDFYTYATRELLGRTRHEWPTILRDQAAVYAVVYATALPLFLLLFQFEILPWNVAVWFFVLLIVEHAAQEIGRVLIAMGRPLFANIVLFLRSGLWVWAVVALMMFGQEFRHLNVVFAAWAVGGISAIVLSVFAFGHLPWNQRGNTIDWRWIRNGIVVGAVFLAASLCLKGLFTLDRYIVNGAAGPDLLGVYTFYISIAMAAIAFLDAGVFAFLYPPVVTTYRAANFDGFRQQMRKLWHNATIATVCLLIGGAVFVQPAIILIDRPIYGEYLIVFWVLLGAVGMYAISMVPHFGLYAFARDRDILFSHAVGFVMFLVTALGTSPVWPMMGVALGLVAGMAVILLVKLWRYSYWHRRLMAGQTIPAHREAVLNDKAETG